MSTDVAPTGRLGDQPPTLNARGMRRDCTCPRARHQHGTNRAYYSDRCRCLDCRDAHRQVSATRRRLIAYGQWNRSLVPVIGSRRRVHALMSQGWSMKALSGRLGMSHYSLEKILRNPGETVRPGTAARIAEMYDELWDQAPPRDTRGENVSYGKAIAHARRRGYLPPLAWDDESIDNPEGSVHIRRIQFSDITNGLPPQIVDEIAVERAMHGDIGCATRAEVSEAIRILTAMGYSATQIADRLGVSGRTIVRKRTAA